MQFTKIIVLSLALTSFYTTQAQALPKAAMKQICSGKPERAQESICQEFCKDQENSADAVCVAGNKANDAAAEKALALQKKAEATAAKVKQQADALKAQQAQLAKEAAEAKAQAKIDADKKAEAEKIAAEAKAEAAQQAAAAKDSDDESDDAAKAEVQATSVMTIPTLLMPLNPPKPADATPQRAEGTTPEGLKWKVRFNFPVCDHSDEGFKKGAHCEATDSSASEKANGVEAELISWIKDPATKGLYLSYFSFSNKNIAAALCVETSLRPDLKVTLFLDKGEAQVGTFANNLNMLDQDISTPGSKRYVEGYKTGCANRLKPRETARGSGSFGGAGNYLQHAKIFMALDKAELPNGPMDLNSWLKTAQRIRFSSSSANMSSFGTTLHFENWIFFDAPASNYVAQQNLCTMVAFKTAVNPENQRDQFKKTYADCERQIQSNPMSTLQFYIVPSLANNKGNGPGNALVGLMNSAFESIKVSIHRFTTSVLAAPLIKKARQGVSVRLIQDDDTLRKGVVDGGAAADVGADDVGIMRRHIDAGVEMNFMETNADTTTHMFHSKYVIADEARVFQGAGNFTSSALNLGGKDGNYEQFYVISIPELAEAYSDAWDYLRTLATPRKQHPVGSNEYLCTYTPPKGQKQLVSCEDPKAEDAHLNVN